MSTLVQHGERVAFPARMSDDQITAAIWPMRYEVVCSAPDMTHVRVLGEAE